MHAHTWPDIPGQSLFPLPVGAGLTIAIDPALPSAAPPALPPGADQRWSALCAANPRLHDGPILAFLDADAQRARIRARPDRFARLAVQHDHLDLGVRLLGVKGLLIGRDHAGAEHVLIARRGRQTRVYPEQWEIAPAGGIHPPDICDGAGTLDESTVRNTLADEAREELGIDLDSLTAGPAEMIAIVRDEIALSVEIIARVEFARPIDPRRPPIPCALDSWEYSDVAWLARADAPGFDRRAAGAIVGPMRAVLRWLAWT